ncbi:MAG: hypothetical protein H6865_02235 [Rhodospirillales bacterium]|nr:hypothetical protein [Alphaproteobacteria bacterium]MCB9986433.1 hypothetical protein [Rhodospirillales bacterium]USO07021.1 MAG: hypothetical protein H6866_06150 [Rhodospirillales bacterium]
MTNLPHGYPDFSALDPEALRRDCADMLVDARQRIMALASDPCAPDFENTALALEYVLRPLATFESWAYIFLNNIGKPGFVEAGREIQKTINAFEVAVFQNRDVYDRLTQVTDMQGDAQIALVERFRHLFFMNGVGLDDASRAQYAANEARLSELKPRFTQNIVRSAITGAVVVETDCDISGLPESAVRAALAEGLKREKPGAHVFLLNMQTYEAVMTFSQNRDLRQAMYTAYMNRAAHDGEGGNFPLLKEIVELRAAQAGLLDFPHYFAFRLAGLRMAKSSEQVAGIVSQVGVAARDAMRQEMKAYAAIAMEDGIAKLEPWDLPYYRRKLIEREFALDFQEIKQHTVLDNVLGALRAHIKNFYDYDMVERPDLPVFTPDARAYEMRGRDGHPVGYLIMDIFARPGEKRDNGWAMDFQSYHVDADGRERLPVMVLACNYSKPEDNAPILLDLAQVQVLFHETGHAMHTIVSRAPYVSLSAFKTVWDFIELPSMLSENYHLLPEVAALYLRHHQTGAPLSNDVIARLNARERHYQAPIVLRQMGFNAIDLALYTMPPGASAPMDWHAWERTVQTPYAAFDMPRVCVLPSFNHIIASSYPAGYYSYVWADIMSAAVFARFEQDGAYDRKLTGIFRDVVLRAGASVAPEKLLKAMTGSAELQLEPYLRKRGLTPL